MSQINFKKVSYYVVSIMVLFSLIAILSKPSQIEIDVKSGTKTLTCEFADGWREIEPEKVVGFNDENGYWTFTNGYAKNCEVR